MSSKIEQYLTYQIVKLFIDNDREIKICDSDKSKTFSILVKKKTISSDVWSKPKGFYKSKTLYYHKFTPYIKYRFPFMKAVLLANFYAWALLRFKLNDTCL